MTASGGIRFGNFTLFRRLARGGMAEVFLARQIGLEGFDRRVAVKRILPHLADSKEFTQMFLREARLAARLTHPNIVHIYDFGKVGTDYFIAMEFVDGVTAGELIARCAKEAMPAVLIARLGADAAVALHYAHELRADNGKQLGLVHRDVSPANVMVSYDGVIKVVDFGIAKAAELHDDKTNPGTVKGKYAYMSPEQTIAARLDGRSDVFSLSIVLWELVAARPIVERGDRVAAMRAIRDGRLPKLEQVAPQTPRQLVEAINWGLARRREDRPDAAQLAQELEAFIKASPELATSMHLAAWLRPRFQSSVEVTDAPESTSTGHTGAGHTGHTGAGHAGDDQEDPDTGAGHTGAGRHPGAAPSEEDLAATIPVQRMSAAEILGGYSGPSPIYYSAKSPHAGAMTGGPDAPAIQLPGRQSPGTGQYGQPGQSGQHGPPGAQTASGRPAAGQSMAAAPSGPQARLRGGGAGAASDGANRPGSGRNEPRAGGAAPVAAGRSGRPGPDPSTIMDTEAVSALPPPRRAGKQGARSQMPSPGPLATPQRTFSEAEQEDYAAGTRRKLMVAMIAVALIVGAFLFTLFVVQPLLTEREAAHAGAKKTTSPSVAPIEPVSEPQAGRARLSVGTTPPSEVLLDERSLGKSPVTEIEVASGTHTLTFRQPGKPPVTRRVTLKPNENVKLNVDLPK